MVSLFLYLLPAVSQAGCSRSQSVSQSDILVSMSVSHHCRCFVFRTVSQSDIAVSQSVTEIITQVRRAAARSLGRRRSTAAVPVRHPLPFGAARPAPRSAAQGVAGRAFSFRPYIGSG